LSGGTAALLRAAVVIVVLVLSTLEASLCWAMVLLQDAVMIDVLVERRGAAARAQ
jgi:hypothetical protein